MAIQYAGPRYRCWRAIRWPGRGARLLIERLISRAAQIYLFGIWWAGNWSVVFMNVWWLLVRAIYVVAYAQQNIFRTVSLEYVLGRITIILRTRNASHLPVQRATTR